MPPYLREILTLVLIFQGTILITLLLIKKGNRSANIFLALYVLVLLLLIGWKTYLSEKLINTIPFLLFFPQSLWFIAHPMQFFYVRTLVGGKNRFRWTKLLHAIPFIIALSLLSPYILLGVEEKLFYLSNDQSLVSPKFDFIYATCVILVGLFYAVWSYVLLKKV